MIILSLAIFTYCTLWIFLVPFLEKNNVMNDYFLPIEVLIYGPHILLSVALMGLLTFIYKKSQIKVK